MSALYSKALKINDVALRHIVRVSLGLMLWGLPLPSYAFTWATEWTQIANFIKLMDSGIMQGEMLTNQAQAEITRINSLLAAEQNLIHAPIDMINNVTASYHLQQQETQQLLVQLQNMQSAYQQAGQMLGSRMVEAQALGANPQQYMAMEAALAQTQGGQYQQAYQRDIQSLQDIADQSAALQNVMANLPSQGNLDGIDRLNTLMSMVAGESLSLNRQFIQAQAEQHAQQQYERQQQQTQLSQQQQVAVQWSQQQKNEQQQLLRAAQQTSGYNQRQMERQAWATPLTP